MPTTVRLPLRLEQALSAYCAEAHKTKSEVIIEVLERRFAEPAAGKTPYELAVEADFVGCCKGFNRSSDLKAQVKAAVRAKHKR